MSAPAPPVVRRHLTLPASTERVWDALTETSLLSAWFGAEVDWELQPGGRARFVEPDGRVRRGRIESVAPGRHLRFRWWSDEGGADDAGVDASEVTYDLTEADDGTALTITERLLVAPMAPSPEASAAALAPGGRWGGWDSRLAWLHAALTVPAEVLVGPSAPTPGLFA